MSLSNLMDGDDGNEENWKRWKDTGYHDNDAESEYGSHDEREEIEEALYAHIFFESHIEEDIDDPTDNKNVKQIRNTPDHHISGNSLPDSKRKEKSVPVPSPLENSVDLQRFKSETYLNNDFLFKKTIVPFRKSDVGILTSLNCDGSRKQSPVSKQTYEVALEVDQQFEKSGKRSATRLNSSDSSISEDSSEVHDDDLLSDSADSGDINLDEILSDMDDIDVHVNKSQLSLLKTYGNCHSSSDTDWSVETNKPDVSLGPKNRYFNIRPLMVQCYNCKETGHMSRDCLKPKKSQTCYLCGFTGHSAWTCPQRICYNCHELGHVVKLCPHSQQQKWRTCFRCQMYGHQQNKCPDIWRCYHMTTIPGKMVKKTTVNKKKFCYNCGEAGHFGFECQEKRMDSYSHPTYPFIAQYKLVHTERKEKHSETKKHKHFDSDVEEPPHKKIKTECYEKKKEIPAVLKQKDSTLKNQDNIRTDVQTFVAYSKGLEHGTDVSLKKDVPWKDINNYSATADKQRVDHRNKSAKFDQQTCDRRNSNDKFDQQICDRRNNNKFDKQTCDRRNNNKFDKQTCDRRNNNDKFDQQTCDRGNNNDKLDQQTCDRMNNNDKFDQQTCDHKNNNKFDQQTCDSRNNNDKFDQQTCDRRNNNTKFNGQLRDHSRHSEDSDFKHQMFDNVMWHNVSNYSDTLIVNRAHEYRKSSKKGKKKKSEYAMDNIVVKETKQKYSKRWKNRKTEKDRTNFDGSDEHLGGYYQFSKGQMKKNKKERRNNFDQGQKSRCVANNARKGNGNWQSSSTVQDLRIQVMDPICTMEQHHQRSNKNGKKKGTSYRQNKNKEVIKIQVNMEK